MSTNHTNDNPILTAEQAERITWHRMSGDYDGYFCSESNPFAPASSPMFWVPSTGGEITADVLRDLTEEERLHQDPWDYDIRTGIVVDAPEPVK